MPLQQMKRQTTRDSLPELLTSAQRNRNLQFFFVFLFCYFAKVDLKYHICVFEKWNTTVMSSNIMMYINPTTDLYQFLLLFEAG